MKKEQKSVLVESVCNELQARPNLYITDISGLSAASTGKLRRACFRRNIKLIMVKNTLLKKAFEKLDTDYAELHAALKGTTAVMLSDVNNAPAQLIKEFRKSSERPILKGAYVEESFYIGDNQLDALVNIKSKNQLVADIIAMLQSPMQNVLGALQSAPNTIGGIVKTLEERTAA
jgi:large subunit ribosomal protein L10